MHGGSLPFCAFTGFPCRTIEISGLKDSKTECIAHDLMVGIARKKRILGGELVGNRRQRILCLTVLDWDVFQIAGLVLHRPRDRKAALPPLLPPGAISDGPRAKHGTRVALARLFLGGESNLPQPLR